jgi:hypothetical protein
LFGDDVLIAVVNVALFFQGKNFIVRLGMVGGVMVAVVRSFLLLVAFFPLLLRACQIAVVTLLVVLTILVVSVVVDLVGGCSHGCCSDRCDERCWHLLLLDFEGCNIWHLNVHGANGRSKRTLQCIGSGFLGSIDSGFWLVAVATCYCPDGGFSAFSLLLAAPVFHSTQEDH